MDILGIFFKSGSTKVESFGALKKIYQDESVVLLSSEPPVEIKGSHNTFNVFFGYFFDHKNSMQLSDNLDEVEGNFVNIKINKFEGFTLKTDKYCRTDLYYVSTEKVQAFSNRLNILLEILDFTVDIDQIALAHSLSVYGNRSPKKSTPYLQIKRLGYREVLTYKQNVLSVSPTMLDLPRTNQSVEKGIFLQDYSDAFLAALERRATLGQNIIFLSSGWDSSSIVAGLNHLVGKDRITCVIGEMRYSQRAGIINSFEIDRARKICAHYDIDLKVVPLDYSSSLPTNFGEIREFLKNNHLASVTAINLFLLNEAVRKFSDDDCRIFAGEMSDGAHNLGFSQFVSIFHPNSLDFREYSDKMMSYLFGPSFLEFANKDTLSQDPVWAYFKNRTKDVFDKPSIQIEDRVIQLLKSFFLRNNRMPFSSRVNLNLLTPQGAQNYEERFVTEYFEPLKAFFSSSYLYSLYLHLYNSFHWQGSTVSSIEITGDYFDLKSTNPFHDEKLIKLLQSMPESYGRGLDFNPTKYPLKWTLENKLNYPMKMNSGYHSYTYDTNPQFSHSEELLFHSSLRDFFRQILREELLIKQLDGEVFNVDYIEDLSTRFIKSGTIDRSEYSDLLSICTNSLIY